MKKFRKLSGVTLYLLLITFMIISSTGNSPVHAEKPQQVKHAPDRKADDGFGPYKQLIIQGATLIDGTGAPPESPMDIVIENNVIKEINQSTDEYPDSAEIIDANGMYVLPGFVDTHGHIGGVAQGVTAEYVYKLWLAHGVTTVREAGSFNGMDWVLEEKERSKNNETVSPRIYSYVSPGDWDEGPLTTPEKAREFVKYAKEQGADGFKLRRIEAPIMEAIIDEANKQDLGTTTHLVQNVVTNEYIPDMTRWGLGSVEHWYGVPEALFEDRTIQDFSPDYDYNNEYDRFNEAGELWSQAAEPGSAKWNEVMDEFLDYGLTMSPTFGIYEATRDQMGVKNSEWHEVYTTPSLHDFFEPDAKSHGSFFFDWTTADEVKWKNNYQIWMQFINEYKNKGGRVTAGSDSGFIYRTYGFSYIRELELLQEAGFNPLEVIRAATLNGAELLAEENNEEITFGKVQPGMLADLIVIDENPLHNLKYLYGTGAIKLDEEKEVVERVGGIQYTIKDGIVYDAKKILDEVEEMVKKEKEDVGESEEADAGIKRPQNEKELDLKVSTAITSGHSIPSSTVMWLIIPFLIIIGLSTGSYIRKRKEE